MKTIDERVVEMRFDNKEFERNARTSLNTLSRLKEALSFTKSTEALENLAKTTKDIKLDGIASGIETLEHRFSTLGIVGMRVVENLTDSLMNTLGKGVGFITDSLVSGGVKRAMNIENAHFQLQALLKDEVKVQAVMADAMESVDGTAYAYDEAAKAASQFAASGIQSGEQMLGALKGITGVAAMTNSSFEDISRIFTTVAGNGRLMGDQLLQLSSRGLNAASTLVDYFKEVRGQTNMTESAIRDMVSKGKISFDDFSAAMTWAFGDSAKRANETFTGALSNMKSALARIGAGFISPLVEQNGEMVQLFNALRIQINNVKSALVFDEQKSAISGLSEETNLLVDTIGKLTKDGSIGFNTFTDAIIGSKDKLENYDEINERISKSFNSVKESGKLTSEALKEFNESGLHATSSLMSFINGVNSGSVKVSESTKKMVAEISNGTYVMESDIEKLVSSGKINFDIFSSAIVKSSNVMTKQADFMSEAFKGLFDSVKKEGHLTEEIFKDLGSSGINVGKVVKDYMNGVADGTIRASYSTKQAIEELRNGVDLTSSDILRLTREGKISFDIFQSSIENMYGNQKSLSKQFTDFFLDNIKAMVIAIESADLTKPMEAFYYSVEAVKNVLKGLWSVLRPIGSAFGDVFLNFNGDDLVSFAEAIERVTAGMKLSDKSSKNLHDTFQGLFSVVKLLTDGLFKLLGISTSALEPMDSFADLILAITGALGRGLTKLTEWIRHSTTARRSFDILSVSVQTVMKWIKYLIETLSKLGGTIRDLPVTQNMLKSITDGFKQLDVKVSPYIDIFVGKLKELKYWVENTSYQTYVDMMTELPKIISDTFNALINLDLSNPSKVFDILRDKLNALVVTIRKNKGIDVFLTNFEEFIKGINKAFTFDNLFDKIDTFKDRVGGFIKWIKENVAPLFSDFSFGGVVATAGGLGMLYTFIKAGKAFSKMTGIFSGVTDILKGIKEQLFGYQKELKANSILKIAAAIALLAAAITLLSFADMKNAWQATIMLGLIGAALLTSIGYLLNAVNKGKTVNDAIYQFSKGLNKSMRNLTAAVKWKAIGNAFKNFGLSITMIAGSIIALGLMYRKDPEAFKAASEMVAMIAFVLVGIMTSMSVVGQVFKSGMQNFSKAALGILALSFALTMSIKALDKLFKMEFPPDWQDKFLVLTLILGELAALALVLGVATRVAGNTKVSSGPFISMAVMLIATVYSLEKLFKMDIPNDYAEKLTILAGIFTGMGALMIMVGVASRIAGGQMKATGTIIAMTAFLVSTVASLMILAIIPGDKLLKGATALGTVLVALGFALAGAGKVASKDAFKTVLSMAIMTGVIVAALGFLSLVPLPQLAKSAAVLGSMLLVLAQDFKQISKVTDSSSLLPIVGMVLIIAEIGGILYLLSKQPWDGILAAGLSISATILALTGMLRAISKSSGIKMDKIKVVLTASLILIPIATSLYVLSKQPWDSLIAASASISIVLLSFAETLKKISAMRGIKMDKIQSFLIASIALVPIAASLYVLAFQPWEGLIAAGTGLSATLLAFATCFTIVSSSKPDFKSIGIFLLATLAIIPIAGALYVLAQQPWEGLLSAAASLSLVLISISATLAICTVIGAAAVPATIGAGLLIGFIVVLGTLMTVIGAIFTNFTGLEGMLDKGIDILVKIGEGLGQFAGAIIGGLFERIASTLPSIGESLSGFWINASIFFNGIASLSDSTFTNMISLAGALIIMTAAELINGIAGLFNCGISDLGKELSLFMINAKPFFNGLIGIGPETVESSKHIVDMILYLTVAELVQGITRVLGLSGSLSDFGKELASFGPHIAEFAKTVKDVKPEAVEGAASAAKIMAECAKTLPGTGGLVQKIFGEKSLSEFGKELVSFGPHIRAFAIIVKDVKPEAVEGAASAAKIMAELANGLPNSGGLASVIFGDNKISDFGKELAIFGPYIKKFAEDVSEISPLAVVGVSAITSIMSSLANDIPNSGGLISWFSGDNNIADFGKNLAEFGRQFNVFYTYLEPIDTNKISSVITEFENLIKLANDAANVDTTGLIGFVDGLVVVADIGIESFCNEFIESTGKVVTAITTMVASSTKSVNTESFKPLGEMSAKYYADGITAMTNTAIIAVIFFVAEIMITLEKQHPKFKEIGSKSAKNYLSGFEENYGKAREVGTQLANNILQGCEGITSALRKAGENAGLGFIEGLKSKLGEASSVGAALGNAAYAASKKSLNEHSPSKKMAEVGENAGLGFIMRLAEFVAKTEVIGGKICNAAVQGVVEKFNNALSLVDLENFSSDPVITPVVDLGNVRKSVSDINDMFNSAITDVSGNIGGISKSIYESKKAIRDSEGYNGERVTNNITNWNFEQTNNSPKALSEVEIYRDTKNLFAMAKGKVKS